MTSSTSSFQHFKEIFLQALFALPRFIKNPIEGMRNLPDWEWPILISLQAVLGLICGLLTAILTRHLLMMITSVVVAPITTVAMNFILSGFFYYTFIFLFKSEIAYRRIFTHLLFASIPVLVCGIIASIVPVVDVIGVLGAACLLYVGFKENFRLDEKKLKILMGGIALFFVASTAFQMIRFHRPNETLKIRATPESLDILEKEFQGE